MDGRSKLYYEALRTRDQRFDGTFFVGVKTTGIYCRPICPARPKPQNVRFFGNRLEAERAGYRPCLRCRPESAPQSPAWIGTSAVVQRASKYLNSALDLDEYEFAARFGLSARHLRRLFIAEIGKTPKQLAFENRLNFARRLLIETNLSLAEGLASGFKSIRRFNDAFKERFKRSPREIRRRPLSKTDGLKISLAYRPPFHFQALLDHYGSHRVGELEWITDQTWYRIVHGGGHIGQIAVRDDPQNSRLIVELDFPDTSQIHTLIARVRMMFDLDSDPVIIANALERDPKFKKMLAKHPGLRMPSGWDPFEMGIATILGQFVSVEFGRQLLADLINMLGERVNLGERTHILFPSPERIAAADLRTLRTTGNRKKTLIAFARAIAEGSLSLEPTQDVGTFIKKALAISGIGPWTANYMALKCLRHPDAFPETDLILARSLKLHPRATIARMSPWQGYAAILLWREYAVLLTHPQRKFKRRKDA